MKTEILLISLSILIKRYDIMGDNSGFALPTFLGFLALFVGFILMIAGYMPIRTWNDHASLVPCEALGEINRLACRNREGVKSTCYAAEIYSRAVGKSCGHIHRLDVYSSQEEAAEALQRYHLPINGTCYLNNHEPCNPVVSLGDEVLFLALGVSFLGVGAVALTITLIIFLILR